jgi:hypothetical protein
MQGLVAHDFLVAEAGTDIGPQKVGFAGLDAVLDGDIHRHEIAIAGGHGHIVLAPPAAVLGIARHLQSLDRGVVELPGVKHAEVAVPARAEVLGHDAARPHEAEFLRAHADHAGRNIDGQEHQHEPEQDDADDDDGGCYLQDLHFAFPPSATGLSPVRATREVLLSIW